MHRIFTVIHPQRVLNLHLADAYYGHIWAHTVGYTSTQFALKSRMPLVRAYVHSREVYVLHLYRIGFDVWIAVCTHFDHFNHHTVNCIWIVKKCFLFLVISIQRYIHIAWQNGVIVCTPCIRIRYGHQQRNSHTQILINLVIFVEDNRIVCAPLENASKNKIITNNRNMANTVNIFHLFQNRIGQPMWVPECDVYCSINSAACDQMHATHTAAATTAETAHQPWSDTLTNIH